MRNTQRKSVTDRVVHREIMSAFDKIAAVFIAIFEMVVALKVTIDEIVSLSGDAGAEKRQRIAESIRDTIRGVRQSELSTTAVNLAKRLGVIEEVTDIPAPQGGKVFRVLVSIDWDKKWKEFILASCPQTDKSWDILKMGDQFESSSRAAETKEVIFLWLGKNMYGTAEKADAWALENNLTASHGRIPAAVIGTIPGIIGQFQNLGYPYTSVGIVSTSQCKLDGYPHIPGAWQSGGGRREAGFLRASDEWSGNSLVAFDRK